LIIGILASLLIPAFGRALNRVKETGCISNMRQIGYGFLGFTSDYDGRLPWQLGQRAKINQFGDHYSWEPNVVFSLSSMKAELSDPRILASPCDPDRKYVNKNSITGWSSFSPKFPIPRKAISYVFCEGADVLRPTAVLSLTRNLSVDDIAIAQWVSSGEQSPHAMGRLDNNKGHILQADGSVSRSSDDDLTADGDVVALHLQAVGGVTQGQSSTLVMGWSGDANIILAQEFFALPSHHFHRWINSKSDLKQRARYQKVIDYLTAIQMIDHGYSQEFAAFKAWALLYSEQYRRDYIMYIVAGRLPWKPVPGFESVR